MIRIFILCVLISFMGCAQSKKLLVGAERTDLYLPKLKNQRVAIFANNTSVVNGVHLVDILVNNKVNVVKIMSPEHGFRGDVPDGDNVNDSVDQKTGIRIVSIYGDKNKKPTPEQLSDVDVVIFDIQDVGARFYTYISSLHYLMEACAENKKKLIVFDRPNPNGFVDGPVLEAENKSFVGMHPGVPIAHGMTIAEYAKMVNGEGWLANKARCEFEVIPLKNYTHNDSISLPVKPSPNLPNDHAIRMYPSICLFEGTALSLGRGTYMPFEVLGHPDLKDQPFEFTPVSIPNMSAKPKLENQLCHGIDLRKVKPERRVSLKYLIEMYNQFPDKEKFFIPYIDKLSGSKEFKEQIKKGMTEEQIRATWKSGLEAYNKVREKYLLYP